MAELSPEARQLRRNTRAFDMGELRKLVLSSAVELARRDGYLNIRREDVALACGVATGSVSRAYGSMGDLRNAIMHEAVNQEIVTLIEDGLRNRHPVACKAPAHLKQKAIALILQS